MRLESVLLRVAPWGDTQRPYTRDLICLVCIVARSVDITVPDPHVRFTYHEYS